LQFFDLDNLRSLDDYTKIRAETDSEALKLRYSNRKIYQKNFPKTSTAKSLYNLTEKIRYEKIGSNNLKGIKQNLLKNYEIRQKYKRKDQLNTKEDVSAKEAFELYLLKHFHNVKLTKLSKEILGFWEKVFDKKLNNKIDFFKQNIHDQEIFNSTFSKIIESMDIGENSEEKDQENESETNNNENQNDNKNEQNNDEREKNKLEMDQNSFETEFDLNDVKMDESLVDLDSESNNNPEIIERRNYQSSRNLIKSTLKNLMKSPRPKNWRQMKK
jgi:cobaltochelatase CobT